MVGIVIRWAKPFNFNPPLPLIRVNVTLLIVDNQNIGDRSALNETQVLMWPRPVDAFD